MRIIDVSQGSPEWLDARLGMPTASQFDRIIQPKNLKPSGSTNKYLYELCAEWAIGESVTDFTSAFMQRGSQLESKAVTFYEMKKGIEVQTVGFVVRNDGKVGCSPDRLIHNDGLLEIKCPSAQNHVGYLLGNPADEYKAQIQGQLYVCDDREYVDLLSYNPVMPPAIIRCVRDETFMEAFEPIMDSFLERFEAMKDRLREIGVQSMLEANRMAYDEAMKELNQIFPE